jgi:hypothetical protein
VAWYNARPELKVPNETLNAEFDRLLGCWEKAMQMAEG